MHFMYTTLFCSIALLLWCPSPGLAGTSFWHRAGSWGEIGGRWGGDSGCDNSVRRCSERDPQIYLQADLLLE